jgi:hypothetical protein
MGAHHQNSIAERKTQNDTLEARTLLLYAMCFWSEYISTVTWPFVVWCMAERLPNLQINLH